MADQLIRCKQKPMQNIFLHIVDRPAITSPGGPMSPDSPFGSRRRARTPQGSWRKHGFPFSPVASAIARPSDRCYAADSSSRIAVGCQSPSRSNGKCGLTPEDVEEPCAACGWARPAPRPPASAPRREGPAGPRALPPLTVTARRSGFGPLGVKPGPFYVATPGSRPRCGHRRRCRASTSAPLGRARARAAPRSASGPRG
jgi:hypothetical protein